MYNIYAKHCGPEYAGKLLQVISETEKRDSGKETAHLLPRDIKQEMVEAGRWQI